MKISDEPILRKRSTGIEWTEHTWNPFAGCSVKSAGCFNCYAMTLAKRLEAMGQQTYTGLTTTRSGKIYWNGKINKAGPSTFNKPLRMKIGSIFFVNSMSDFWHENADDAWRLEAWQIMVNTPRHQYQILTKRPDEAHKIIARMGLKVPDNVWLGVTIEDRKAAEERLELCKRFPAKIKFLSVEPLIGPTGPMNLEGIDWVITGGESGGGARPMEANWLREVRDQCLMYNVPHFFKQWGIPKNNPLMVQALKLGVTLSSLDPIGKGGSLLDGRAWKQMPGGHVVAAYGDLPDESKA